MRFWFSRQSHSPPKGLAARRSPAAPSAFPFILFHLVQLRRGVVVDERLQVVHAAPLEEVVLRHDAVFVEVERARPFDALRVQVVRLEPVAGAAVEAGVQGGLAGRVAALLGLRAGLAVLVQGNIAGPSKVQAKVKSTVILLNLK